MHDYDHRSRRCLHDGITLVRLPQHIDPRGPDEQRALARAYADHAWRHRHERKRPVPAIPRNILRFGSAAGGAT